MLIIFFDLPGLRFITKMAKGEVKDRQFWSNDKISLKVLPKSPTFGNTKQKSPQL